MQTIDHPHGIVLDPIVIEGLWLIANSKTYFQTIYRNVFNSHLM